MRYLWKEWRDHRAVVLGIALAIPSLLFLARLLLPENMVADPLLPQVAALGTLAIALLAFGTDLVPGEARRGRLTFLARLPGGLPAAFRAKAVFFLLVLAVAPLYGFAAGACFSGWPDEGLGFASDYALLLLCAAPWIFAVSCWLPRGALALPATALVLGTFAVPIYLLHLATPTYYPLETDIMTGAVLLGIGALPIAWLSFTRGYRHGGTFLSAGWRGLAASLVLLIPAYGYTGYRMHEWDTVDPKSENFRVISVFTGDNERYLFANAKMVLRHGRQERLHALIVDTRSGTWRRAGTVFNRHVGIWLAVPARVVDIIDPGSATRDEHDPKRTKYWTRYFDADTAERFTGGWSNVVNDKVWARVAASRPAWHGSGSRVCRLGLGYLVQGPQGRWQIADPVRERVYDAPPKMGWPTVLREGWLFHKNKRYVLRDPDTGKERPLGLSGNCCGVLHDGRVLVRHGKGVRVIDLTTGAEAAMPDVVSASWIRDDIYRVQRDGASSIDRIDPEQDRFEVLLRKAGRPIVTTRSILFIEDDRSVRRMELATRKITTLFP